MSYVEHSKINSKSKSACLTHKNHLQATIAQRSFEFVSLSFKTFVLFQFIAYSLIAISVSVIVIFPLLTLTQLLLLQGSEQAFIPLEFSHLFSVFQPWLFGWLLELALNYIKLFSLIMWALFPFLLLKKPLINVLLQLPIHLDFLVSQEGNIVFVIKVTLLSFLLFNLTVFLLRTPSLTGP